MKRVDKDRALTTTPDTPEPNAADGDSDVPSSVEGSETEAGDAPGAEMGISEEGSSFEPEEDPEAQA